MVGLIIYVVTSAVIPRGLGPKAYGDFNFLTSFFVTITAFLDMGTSVAFYTKIANRQKEFSLVAFYLYFSGLISLLMFVVVFITAVTTLHLTLWPDQGILYVSLAALWAMMTWYAQVLNQMGDAYGLTVRTEMARISQRVLGLAIIITLFLLDRLNLLNLFFYHYVILLCLSLSFVWIIEKQGVSFRQSWRLSRKQLKSYVHEFYTYSHPLFTYSLIGLFIGIFDRWVLQFFSGSVQQGFFSLSYQIGAGCFLFTSAMTPLIMREFSIAFGDKDLSRMASLFRRYIPLLYSITAYFACFVAMQAGKVTHIFGGAQFHEATIVVAIMSFFPIHQTYGQLSGSIFFAADQTRLYRNIGIIFMLASLPVTFFLIAPVQMMGLGTGATGLAVKLVLFQFITVNVMLYFNAKLLHLNFLRYFGHQIVSVAALAGIAFISVTLLNHVSLLESRAIASFILSGILYTILVVCLILLFPPIFGITRADIFSLERKMISIIRLGAG